MLLLVERLLQRKLGPLPESISAQLEQLTIAQLEHLSDALFDFASPDDLARWLDHTTNPHTEE